MKKKLIAVVLSATMVFSSVFSVFAADTTTRAYEDDAKNDRAMGTIAVQIGNYAATVDSFLTAIDPDNKEVVPYIKNNRTYIPLRFIAENLDAQVSWDSGKREAVIQKGDTKIVIPSNGNYYYVNSVKHDLDAPAEIYQNRTFVPLRFVAEALDMSVYWEQDSKMAIIAPKDRPWTGTDSIEEDLIVDYLLVISPFIRDFYIISN